MAETRPSFKTSPSLGNIGVERWSCDITLNLERNLYFFYNI
jgi:hypothetical protein